MPSEKYILDSNVFIQAKNLYYRFDFCDAFWKWLSEAHEAGIVYSIEKVKKELLNGNNTDQAKIWAQNQSASFFLPDTSDSNVMNEYVKIIQWSTTSPHYTPQAKTEFANSSEADAFLLAAAKHHNYVVVSQEESDPNCKRRVLIPDAANQLGIKSIFIYDLLSHKAEKTFKLK